MTQTKEERRAYHHQYYLAHRRKIRRQRHKYYQTHKIAKRKQAAAYAHAHPVEVAAKHHQRYVDHIEENRAKARKYYHAHKKARNLYGKQWRKKNRVATLKRNKERTQILRTEILTHYGAVCRCCGETTERFLTVDHIANDGAAHRKMIRKGGSSREIYRWLIDNNYPKGFQILCYNCNCGRALNDGICPHKNRRAK